MAAQIERLRTAPVLTRDLVTEAAAQVMGISMSIAILISRLTPDERHVLIERATVRLNEQAKGLLQLPTAVRRQAARALATVAVVAGLGVSALSSRDLDLDALERELRRIRDEGKDERSFALFRTHVLVAAVLESQEWGEEDGGRIVELARLADDAAYEWAQWLVEVEPENPTVKLPWYFRPDSGADAFQSFARWAEDRTSANDRAVDLLSEWARADAAAEQSTWEEIKRGLDSHRTSNRPLFP